MITAIWAISMEFTIKTGVQFISAPDNISVVINDKTYIVNYETTIELKPGSYHAKLSHADFKSDEQDIVVSENKITKIYSALEPTNDTGKKIISTDTMIERRRIIFGNTSSKGPEEKASEYPFINKLPIVDKNYIINPCYGKDNKQPFGICVILAVDNITIREKAVNDMGQKGIDTSEIPVYYYLNTPIKD